MIRDYQALQRTWFEEGKQRVIRTTGKHRGLKLLSTVDYCNGKIVWHEDEAYTAETFLTFLNKVMDAYPSGTITMVLDNARIHHAKLLEPFSFFRINPSVTLPRGSVVNSRAYAWATSST